MDCLIVLNTCLHPLDPSPDYHSRPVKLEVLDGDGAVPTDDECRLSHPENERALINTEDYHKLRF